MKLSDLRRICDDVGEGPPTWDDPLLWRPCDQRYANTFNPELVGHLLDCVEAECNCSLDECWGDCPQLLAKHRLDAYLKDCDAQ